jgi:diguanylate cyclase (GGDEF)-like protein
LQLALKLDGSGADTTLWRSPILSRPVLPPVERILYVDDEREAREAFACAAHELGFRVDTADGGGEALTKASQNRYAVIATDLRMPTLNGLSLIQLLRPKWPETSYLIVTGASHLDLPRLNGEPLVDEVVAKPWKLEELSGILGRAIDRYRGRTAAPLEPSSDELPVLLLASDEFAAARLRGCLEEALPGLESAVASTLEEALDSLSRTEFRAAFVDLDGAPGGLSSIQRLRKAQEELPLVALGALEDEQLRHRAMGAGAQDYLPKAAITGYTFRQSLRYAIERKQTEEKLSYLAHRDPLSGLFNRRLFRERLELAVREAARRGSSFAVLLLDLDRFKTVNDSLGHGIGDRLLEAVAGRIRTNVHEEDVVARLGGDEFAVLLNEVYAEEEALEAAQRLLEALVPPVRLGDYEIGVTASVGICLYPDHGETAEEILGRADKAMYRAKLNGRDGCELFSDEQEESRSGVLERLRFESGIRSALERNEYVIFYQPQLTIDRRKLVAVEALVRWNHPKFGLVPPAKFMPFLETTGLIKTVGAWVLETAAAEVRGWQREGFADLRLTVNLSARQFESPDLVEGIVKALSASGFAPSQLELEITESLLMRDIDRTRAILEELKLYGIRIAIDDFGTGYSSLAYLTKFPLDCLKIDRSFVRDIETDADDRAVAEAIIGLGHNLRLDVVAEGVETEPQLSFLQGCDGFQGYLVARPQPAPQTLDLLERYRA